MKKTLLTLFVVLAFIAGSSSAKADSINFSQFGDEGDSFGSTLSGFTSDGVGVTLTSPNGSFEMYTEGSNWHGIFPDGAPILFDGIGSGSIILDFATGITSLTLAGQSNNYGEYIETAVAYNSAFTLVDTATATAFNYVWDDYPLYVGTVPFLTLTGTDIKRVEWGATNDSNGLALYGGVGAPSTVPEPSTIVLLGLGMAGLAFYGKRRKNNKT